MADKYFVEESRKSWFTSAPVTNGDLQTGCLMRIATATEAMAKSHIQLQNEYNYMRDSRDRYRTELQEAKNKIRGLKGAITRMKKK